MALASIQLALRGRRPGHSLHTLYRSSPGQAPSRYQPGMPAHVALHRTHAACAGSGANHPLLAGVQFWHAACPPTRYWP